METIGDTVKKVILSLEEKNKLRLDSFEGILKKCLTKQEFKHIKVSNFKKGFLNIIVDSSGWLYKLSLKKEELLAGLRTDLPVDIKGVHFCLGELK